MPIKTCMILDTPFPPDIRVEKEARTLIKNGFEVHLLCIGKKNETKKVGDIFVHKFTIDRSLLFNRLLHYRPLINYFYINHWKKILLRLYKKENFSIFHAHDLSTAPFTIWAGKKANISVILDMHENYPEAQKSYLTNNKKKLSIITKFSYWLNRFIEKICISNAFHVITVVQERKNQLITQGFKESKISVLSNTVDINFILKKPITSKLIEKYKDKFVITYIGGFGIHRGLETLIESVASIKQKINKLCLLFVGGRLPQINHLKTICHRLGLSDNVEFAGWTNFNQIPSYINLSTICIIPHKKNGHTDTTIPHKLFQYMLFEKPVIATNCLPLKRIIQETKCGITVISDNHRSMADAIITLHNNPILTKKLGKNGKKAVISKYNWETEGKTLLKIYESVQTS